MSLLIWPAARFGAVLWMVAVVLACGPATVAQAEDNPEIMAARDALAEAIRVPELLEVMREEGQDYGAGIGGEFLPDGGGATWSGVVDRIYDLEKMEISVARGMAAELKPEHLEPLLTFFQSETGHRIAEREILARRAFLDPATEDAAREALRNAGDALETRVGLLEDYVRVNDLVEFNVAGALTANLRFYRGLVEGGAFELSEEDMLADVWEQEAAIRADTGEWLMAYLLMAYAELSDEEIRAYIALSESAAGQALNRALFAGFDGMYADLSYALGLAVAAQLKGEDL